jgi:hypothetical protein
MLKLRTSRIAKPSIGRQRPVRRRRGLLTIEMLIVLPILFTVLLAVFEFSILFFARSSVVQACRAAARRASLGVTDQAEIEDVVNRVLSPNLQYNHTVYFIPAERAGEITTVGLTVPMSTAAPDLLWPIGFSLQGRFLIEETSVVRE